MAIDETQSQVKQSWAERLMSIPRMWLYMLLIVIVSLSLFPPLVLPSKPQKPTIDFFEAVMKVPEGKTVILMSDWSISTRGENSGMLEALLRIFMRKNVKFAMMATADSRAMQVARDVLARIDAERKLAGEKPYEKWTDYVEIGYFPNVEGTFLAMANNLRTAWAGKKDNKPGVGKVDVFESPVLKGVSKVQDVALIVDIHASDVAYRMIERLYGKVPLTSMCTGVMGPETLNYYSTRQLIGVIVGLNGVVELETLMEQGMSPDGAGGSVKVPGRQAIPGFKGQKNLARGTSYYLALHTALTLMIVAVVIGNLAMFASRKRAKA